MTRSLPPSWLPRPVRLGLIAAAWLAGAAAGPALAQTGTNGNPGITSSTIISASTHQQLTFLPPTVINQQANAYATEIIGRLGGSGSAIYDVTVPDAFGSAAAQIALASAQAALLAVGGSGTTFAAPALLSSALATSSNSSTIYSLDPAFNADTTGRYFSVTSVNTFGPALVMGAVAGQPSTVARPGDYSLCGGDGTIPGFATGLPSATAPTCSPVDGGTLFVLPGQLDINIDTTFIFPIDTTTTVASTTTLTQAYELVGTPAAAPTSVPEPAGWPVFAVGLASLGLLARRSRGEGCCGAA